MSYRRNDWDKQAPDEIWNYRIWGKAYAEKGDDG
jgi:hypothetical protein